MVESEQTVANRDRGRGPPRAEPAAGPGARKRISRVALPADGLVIREHESAGRQGRCATGLPARGGDRPAFSPAHDKSPGAALKAGSAYVPITAVGLVVVEDTVADGRGGVVEVDETAAAAVSGQTPAEHRGDVGAADRGVAQERAPSEGDGSAGVEQAATMTKSDIVVARRGRSGATVAADRSVVGEHAVLDGQNAAVVSDRAARPATDELELLGADDDATISTDRSVADKNAPPDRTGQSGNVVDGASEASAGHTPSGLVRDKRAVQDEHLASVLDGAA